MPKVELIREISDDQYHWRNDPSIFAWTRQNHKISPKNMVDWLNKIEADSTIRMFGILCLEGRDPGRNVGTCGLTSISLMHGTAEFSLLIGPEYQKKGYGKEALKELLKYGFDHLRLNLIFGETFVGNPALKMFKDLGMKEEGLLRARYYKNGHYIDSIPVSIRKDEVNYS